MCTIVNSFDQLKAACKSYDRVDSTLFEILSSSKSSDAKRRKALKELEHKVDSILAKLNDKSYLIGSEDMDIYADYCRNLAAFAYEFCEEPKSIKALIAIESLLELFTPVLKPELRSVKKSLKAEDVKIKSLGYNWKDLNLPFYPEEFAHKFLLTDVLVPAEPKVIVLEKVKAVPTFIEKEVVKTVEKTVYIEKELEDNAYFGVENQCTEFKSSFVVAPPDQDIQDQKIEVCRKICGFLNADGGKLYIGVEDQTRRAYPETLNGSYVGIWGDIRYYISSDRYGNPVRTIDEYIKYVKNEISHILTRYNQSTSLRFINDCIHVERSKHDNVICIDVKPSKYCVVYLNGIAYKRDGEECKEMSEEEIILRNDSRKTLGKESRFESLLLRAIRNKKQVILRRYQSGNSNSVSDRRVEPYAFTCNNEAILCYDIDKHAIRQFKLSRIEDVKILKTDWAYSEMHDVRRTDIFDWSFTGEQYHICMHMSIKAISNLREKFNVREEECRRINDNEWVVDTIVYSLEPAVGFYLSMAKEISIQETEHYSVFKQEISNYVYNYVLS